MQREVDAAGLVGQRGQALERTPRRRPRWSSPARTAGTGARPGTGRRASGPGRRPRRRSGRPPPSTCGTRGSVGWTRPRKVRDGVRPAAIAHGLEPSQALVQLLGGLPHAAQGEEGHAPVAVGPSFLGEVAELGPAPSRLLQWAQRLGGILEGDGRRPHVEAPGQLVRVRGGWEPIEHLDGLDAPPEGREHLGQADAGLGAGVAQLDGLAQQADAVEVPVGVEDLDPGVAHRRCGLGPERYVLGREGGGPGQVPRPLLGRGRRPATADAARPGGVEAASVGHLVRGAAGDVPAVPAPGPPRTGPTRSSPGEDVAGPVQSHGPHLLGTGGVTEHGRRCTASFSVKSASSRAATRAGGWAVCALVRPRRPSRVTS